MIVVKNDNQEKDCKVGNDRYLKEMELIQRCIDRMANNSFKIKRWLAAMLVLTLGIIASANGIVGIVAGTLIMVVVVMLALMDTYYLALEKIYRKRYEYIVREGWRLERYALSSYGVFELNPRKINSDGGDGLDKDYSKVLWGYMRPAFWSMAILPFYSVSVVIVVVISICMWYT